jgi:hypothetical protein
MSADTQGEWIADFWLCNNKGFVTVRTAEAQAAQATVICHVPMKGRECSDEEATNAFLLAGAKRLLLAAKAAEAVLRKIDPSVGTPECAALLLLVEATAKAEGRA